MYNKKSSQYFTHTRIDIIRSLEGKVFNNVLELGAGGCDTLLYMKQNGLAKHITGVELFDIPNSNQHHADLDKLFIASIENLYELPLQKKTYDLVICGDVLEHVFDPWQVLKNVKELMAPNGMVVCSIPNFREFQTMRKIFIEGDFAYNPEGGILDRTHMRFFCKKNIRELFTTTGFQIQTMSPTFKWVEKANVRKHLNTLTFGLFEELVTYQYLVAAVPC